jgi:hypothetical protein
MAAFEINPQVLGEQNSIMYLFHKGRVGQVKKSSIYTPKFSISMSIKVLIIPILELSLFVAVQYCRPYLSQLEIISMRLPNPLLYISKYFQVME